MKQAIEKLCAPRLHCPTCRDLEGGRQWRGSLHRAFKLPNDEVDFECPHGLSWGCGPQTESQKKYQAEQEKQNAEIKRIGTLCETCVAESDRPEWDEDHPDFFPQDDCEFLKSSACSRKRKIREGTAICPLERW